MLCILYIFLYNFYKKQDDIQAMKEIEFNYFISFFYYINKNNMEHKKSKCGSVAFIEETHEYIRLKDNKKLKSVSSKISDIRIPFDEVKEASIVAIRRGTTKDKVLATWKAKNQLSIDKGNYIHEVMEAYVLNRKVKTNSRFDKHLKGALKFIKDYYKTNRLTVVDVEVLVFDDNIAGQLDVLAKNSKGEYFILDYKTNDNLLKRAYNKLKYPFSHLDDTKLEGYNIQLNTYAYLLEKERNIKIKGLYIIYIEEDDYRIITINNEFRNTSAFKTFIELDTIKGSEDEFLEDLKL